MPAFAKQTVEWDEHGGSLETYFGPDGKPIVIEGRVVKGELSGMHAAILWNRPSSMSTASYTQ